MLIRLIPTVFLATVLLCCFLLNQTLVLWQSLLFSAVENVGLNMRNTEKLSVGFF